MSYAFNSPPKITPTELEPGHGLMPKKQGSAQPDLRDEIARLTAERDDWARKAMEWRRKYAELRYPGMTNEVHAHGVKPAAHAQSHLCGSDCAEAAVGGPRCEGPCAVLGLYPMDETAQGVPASRPEGSAPAPTDGSAE